MRLIAIILLLGNLANAQTLRLDMMVTRTSVTLSNPSITTKETVWFEYKGKDLTIYTSYETLELKYKRQVLQPFNTYYVYSIGEQEYWVFKILEDGLSYFIVPIKPYYSNPYTIQLAYEKPIISSDPDN